MEVVDGTELVVGLEVVEVVVLGPPLGPSGPLGPLGPVAPEGSILRRAPRPASVIEEAGGHSFSFGLANSLTTLPFKAASINDFQIIAG